MINIKAKRRWMTFLVVFLIWITTSFAAENGLTITTWTDAGGDTYRVTKLNRTTRLPEGSIIQFLSSIGAPNPDNPGLLPNPDAQFASGTVGGENTGVQLNPKDGEFDYYFKKEPGTYYVRVWDTKNTPQRGDNYNHASVSVSAPPNPPVTLSVNLSTTFKADAPPAPNVKENKDYSLAYTASGQYLPKFSLSIVKNKFPDTSNCEYTGYIIQVRKEDEAWGSQNIKEYRLDAAVTDTANIEETDPDSPYYIAGGKYVAHGAAYNHFDSSPWGPELPFTIPETTMGPATTFTFDLYGTKTDKLIVNTISIPSGDLFRPVDYVGVKKAPDLAKVINQYANATAGQDVFPVRAICWWDPVTGLPKRALFSDKGVWDPASDDLDIVPGVGYMVYLEINAPLTEDMMRNIVFEGK